MRLLATFVPVLLSSLPMSAQVSQDRPISPMTRAYPGIGLLQLNTFGKQVPLPMDSPWSYQRLGLFCKLDVQLERGLRLPVLFRLGDVQRVEAMEGKGPWRDIPLY
jgi:hypothetical protein